MNPMTQPFEIAQGVLRRSGLPLLLPKGLVLRALIRAGWKGTDGTLPEEVARHLVDEGPFHLLFQESRGDGKAA